MPKRALVPSGSVDCKTFITCIDYGVCVAEISPLMLSTMVIVCLFLTGLMSSKDLHQWRIQQSAQLKKSSILGRRSANDAAAEPSKRR